MNHLLLRLVALSAILVGILSLFGIRPMNSRATEVVLGTAALALGLALLLMNTSRSNTGGPPRRIA